MSEQIITTMKRKLDGLSAYGYSITDPETRLNALKEELQLYALDLLSEQTKKLEGVYKQKLADLGELKKSVLNKAFSGEL